ncbi:MAG: hypothetical protein IT208_13415 [Chthonomonadales bacterium]|nr:hypothetical protein [Chthonomonadales bacterium]
MKARRPSSAVIAALLTVGALAAQSASAQEASYSLKRVYRQGEVDRYRTIIHVEQQTAPAGSAPIVLVMTLTTTETTREVKPDGGVVLENRLDSAVVSLNGKEEPLPGPGQAVTLTTLDKDGKPVRQETTGQTGIAPLIAMTRPAFLIPRPLKVGEQLKLRLPEGPETAKTLDVSITLVELAKKAQELPSDALRVKSVADGVLPGAAGAQRLHAEMTSLMEPEGARLLRVDGTVTGLVFPQIGPARMTFRVVRLPSSAAPPTATH